MTERVTMTEALNINELCIYACKIDGVCYKQTQRDTQIYLTDNH